MGRSDNRHIFGIDAAPDYNAVVNRNDKPTFRLRELREAIQVIFPKEYQAALLNYLEEAYELYAPYKEKAGSYWDANTNMAIAIGDSKVGKLLYDMLAPKDKDGNLLLPEAAIGSIRIKWYSTVTYNLIAGDLITGKQTARYLPPVAIIADGYTIDKYAKIRLAWVSASPDLGYDKLEKIVRNARNGQFDYLSIALLASDSSDSQELLKTFSKNYIEKYLPLTVQKDGLHLPVSPNKKGVKPVYEPLGPSRAILCTSDPDHRKQSQKKR
jgi:hypothetical protein